MAGYSATKAEKGAIFIVADSGKTRYRPWFDCGHSLVYLHWKPGGVALECSAQCASALAPGAITAGNCHGISRIGGESDTTQCNCSAGSKPDNIDLQ